MGRNAQILRVRDPIEFHLCGMMCERHTRRSGCAGRAKGSEKTLVHLKEVEHAVGLVDSD
jgi:hypothetical protein